MTRTPPGDRLGDKLGPRLVQLAVGATLAARRSLGPFEARVRAAGTQQLIDRAGLEVADHFRPFLAPLLAGEHGPIHPDMAAYLERSAAGTHQWHSIAGLLGQGVQSALGGAVSNAVAPIAYEINALGPNLNLDAQVWANGAAAGYAGFSEGQQVAHQQGLGGGNYQLLVDLAASLPGADVLFELVNRGIIGLEEAESLLHRQAVPAGLRGQILELRRQLLSPADAALAVLRGTMADGRGREVAAASGMNGEDFETLLSNTGEPLGLEQLAEALRRGFINTERFARGLRQSRVRNEWLDVAEELRFTPIPTADAIDAWQRGRISEELADQIAQQNGVLPAQVPILRLNAGNPPSPEQLLDLWRRGMVTEQQVDDGLRQGRTRDEWVPQIKDLRYEPVSTADAIDAWLRGHITEGQADEIAEQNGILPAQVAILKADAGSPLALEQLLEAHRRGFITTARMKEGIKQGRIRDDWAQTAIDLSFSPMTTADAVEASIQGYITKDRARELAVQNGLAEADFEALWETAGDPLARTELQQLFNRHLITLEDYQQGLRESRLKDKYVNAAIQLHVRQPEPREIIAGITDGVITAAAGLELLREQGYTEQVARMLISEGEVHATGPHRQVMTAQIQGLYSDRIISRETAAELLEQLHYTGAVAGQLLHLADFTAQQRILDSGIGMIRAHYLAHRLADVDARADLLALRLPHASVDLYLQVWGYDRLAHPRQLSEAQIVKAAKNHLLVAQGDLTPAQWDAQNEQAGTERLVQLGYDRTDAALLIAGA